MTAIEPQPALSPQDIADDSTLSSQQKIDRLEKWEVELRQLMDATEEGMAGGKPGQNGDMLRKVHIQLERLKKRD